MKNIMILALALMLAACGAAPEGEQVDAQDAVETTTPAVETVSVAVDTDASTINWVGAKFTGDQHTGTIQIAEGNLMTSDGNLVGGNFTIDMNTIEVTDETPQEMKAKLVGHLSTGDFFEVEKFGTAAFEITSIEAVEGNAEATHKITGNLTMKDISKSITIPATVSINESGISAKTPQFVIDRTQWGVMYGSTAAGALKDKAIKNEIALQINLSTK
ncbi:YceI family protein [Lewinella cohaerens]|uniref:YceI family protein n=1 Tax=Lewinella cohaerens TaxID=70995 RepID=UPI00039AC03A|nr:YceI family protein [Lewinella cohaerens]